MFSLMRCSTAFARASPMAMARTMDLLRSASMALVWSRMSLRSAAAALAMLCTTPVTRWRLRSARLALAATTLVSMEILVANWALARLRALAEARLAAPVAAESAAEAAAFFFCMLHMRSYRALVALERSLAISRRLRSLRPRALASLCFREVARAFTSAEAA